MLEQDPNKRKYKANSPKFYKEKASLIRETSKKNRAETIFQGKKLKPQNKANPEKLKEF